MRQQRQGREMKNELVRLIYTTPKGMSKCRVFKFKNLEREIVKLYKRGIAAKAVDYNNPSQVVGAVWYLSDGHLYWYCETEVGKKGQL